MNTPKPKWLEGLKVGDKVIVKSSGTAHLGDVRLVQHVTKTTIAVGTQKYRREGGHSIGTNRFYGSVLQEPTTERIQAIEHKALFGVIKHDFSGHDPEKFTYDQLRRIAAILNEGKWNTMAFAVNEAGEKVFTISRLKWLRGKYSPDLSRTALCASSGERCCIGHCLTAHGIPDDLLRGKGEPCESGSAVRNVPWLVEHRESVFEDDMIDWANSIAAGELMQINDDWEITDSEREEKITAVFRAHGYLPVFVD